MSEQVGEVVGAGPVCVHHRVGALSDRSFDDRDEGNEVGRVSFVPRDEDEAVVRSSSSPATPGEHSSEGAGAGFSAPSPLADSCPVITAGDCTRFVFFSPLRPFGDR